MCMTGKLVDIDARTSSARGSPTTVYPPTIHRHLPLPEERRGRKRDKDIQETVVNTSNAHVLNTGLFTHSPQNIVLAELPVFGLQLSQPDNTHQTNGTNQHK